MFAGATEQINFLVAPFPTPLSKVFPNINIIQPVIKCQVRLTELEKDGVETFQIEM